MRRLGPATAPARQHVALDGVAHAVRNSHQTSPHLPGPRAGRATRDSRERHLAKDCVGSDRGRKERSRLPEAKRRQPRRTTKKRQREQRRIPRDQRRRGPIYARRYGYAPTRSNTVSPLTYSFRNGPAHRLQAFPRPYHGKIRLNFITPRSYLTGCCHRPVNAHVSAISFIDPSYLADPSTSPYAGVVPRLVSALTDRARRLNALPVAHEVANSMACLSWAEIPDVPDRVIAATALAHGRTSVSADAAMRGSMTLRASPPWFGDSRGWD